MDEIVKASEFGVEEKQAKELTTGLDIVISEREPLIESYKNLIETEITEENIPVFKALRQKIVKNRTQGIEKWHKTSKAFFLAGGKFCDALKNKEMLVNTNMEEKLMDAEKYFENLEAEKLAKIENERHLLCVPFVESEEMILNNLGSLSEPLWNNYIIGLETSFNARKAAEKKSEEERIETERIEKLSNERYLVLIPFADFFEPDEKELILSDKLGSISETIFNAIFDDLKIKKSDYETEQEKIRLENERLKKEAELKAKQAEKEHIERERLAKIEADKQAEKERITEAKNEAARLAHIAELKRISNEKAEIERKLKVKQAAELAETNRLQQLATDKLEAEKKAALAPEKDKITLWIDSFNINEIDSNKFSMSGQATVNVIEQKFKAFKKWAIEQKETIK